MRIDLSVLVPAEEIKGEDDDDTKLLLEMWAAAERYVNSFLWCQRVSQGYMGLGIGGVVAVFLCRIDPAQDGVDEWLWVVEGDLPSAYLVTDDASNPSDALRVYCNLMEDWAEAVLEGWPLKNVFPVDAISTQQNAQDLLSRIKFIRTQVLC